MSLKIEKTRSLKWSSNTLSRGRSWEDRVSYEYYVIAERGASVTQACCNAVVATCYVLLNLTYLHTYHARLDTSMLSPFRTSLYPISLQRGSEKLDGANLEETSFKQLLSCNMKLLLYRISALSFKQLQFHKIAQRQLHSPARDGLRQIQFTVNQAARTRRQVFAIAFAFETAHFNA